MAALTSTTPSPHPTVIPHDYSIPPEQGINDSRFQFSFDPEAYSRARGNEKFIRGNLSLAQISLRERKFTKVTEFFDKVNVSLESGLRKILTLELFSQGVAFAKTIGDSSIRDQCLLICMARLTVADPDDPRPKECLAAFKNQRLKSEAEDWYEKAKNAGMQKLKDRDDSPSRAL